MFRTARYSTGWLIMYGSLKPVINRIIARRTPIRPGLRTSFWMKAVFVTAHWNKSVRPYKNVEYGNENWAVKPTVITENCLLEGQRHKCTVWIDCCKADNSLTAFIFIMKNQVTDKYWNSENKCRAGNANYKSAQKFKRELPLKSRNHNAGRHNIQYYIGHVTGGKSVIIFFLPQIKPTAIKMNSTSTCCAIMMKFSPINHSSLLN